MHKRLFVFLLGRIALLNGMVMILPFLYSFFWQEEGYIYFGPSILIALGIGGLLIHAGRIHKRQMSAVEGAWYMVLVWLLLGGIGMLPYILSGWLSIADAFFESISAFTTTGISCISDTQGMLPPSLLLWHSMMSWMGGLNFILLLVTVVPLVSGSFGLTLSAHQSIRFSPVVGRMQNAARQTGKMYAAITIISIILYSMAGLPLVDACIKALMTVSTSGGNTVFDFAQQNSISLEIAGMLSMILASGNFLLYWKGVERRAFRTIFADTELQVFLAILLGMGLLVSIHLWHMGVYNITMSLRYGFFQVVSFCSTSGFITASITNWPEFDKFILFALVFIGGCIGSAAGGMRVMRFVVLFKIAKQEMRRTLHPHMVISLKINGIPVDMKIISRVLSYFFLFMAVFFISTVIISLSGIEPMQAMGVAVGCLSSTGATASLFGITDFSLMPTWVKLYCALLMILGRLEIFSFLIILQTGMQYLHRRW